MMVYDVFQALHRSHQGICVLDGQFSKLYENEKAKAIFAGECPDLYQHFQAVCQNNSKLINEGYNSLANQSGTLRYPYGLVVFTCFSVGEGEQASFYFIFDYVPLIEAPLADGILLTKREKEIVQIMAHGKTNRQIGEILGIGLETVKSHIRNLFAKTGAGSRVELLGKVRHTISIVKSDGETKQRRR